MRYQAGYNQATVIHNTKATSSLKEEVHYRKSSSRYIESELGLILSFVAAVAIAVVCILRVVATLVANIILGMVALIMARVLRLERLAPCIWWCRSLVVVPSIWWIRSVQISNAAILSLQRDVRVPRSLSRKQTLLPILAARP